MRAFSVASPSHRSLLLVGAITLLATPPPRATADEPRPAASPVIPSWSVEIARVEHGRGWHGPVEKLDPFLAAGADPAAHRRAIVALGRIGSNDQEVVPRLVRLLRSGSPDLDLSLWAAGISGHKILVPAVLPQLAAKDERTLLAALEALGMLGDPHAARRIAPFLSHESAAVRTAAAYALSRAGSADVFEAIVARVGEADANARRAVAAAVWRCAGVTKKARTTTTVIWSDPAAAAALAPLARDPDPETRIFALRGLNILWPTTLAGDPALVAAGAAADPDPRVVADFVFRLLAGKHDGPVVLRTISAALDNPDALVRETAAEAAGKIGSPDAAAVLRERLSRESDARVRERIAIALAACGDDDVAAQVLVRGDRPNDPDRRAVVEAQVLLASQKPDPHARALAMLKDPKTPVLALEALLDGFADLDPPDLGPLLLTLIQNGDSVVAGSAADLAAKKGMVDLLGPIIEAYVSAVTAVAGPDPLDGSDSHSNARDRGRDARQGFVEAVARLQKAARKTKDWALGGYSPQFNMALARDPSSVVRNAAREASRDDEKADVSPFRPEPPEWTGLPRPKAPILGLDLTRGDGRLSEEEVLRLAHRIAETKALLVVETQGLGVTKFRLDAEDAPVHAASTVIAATMGVYDGTPWHRVVPAFVIQGADPRGDGSGDAGWLLPDEITRRPFWRGALGMPKGVKDTGGCQLFVMHCYAPHLDGRYTAFGEAVEGMDVVDRIRVGDRIKSARVVVP